MFLVLSTAQVTTKNTNHQLQIFCEKRGRLERKDRDNNLTQGKEHHRQLFRSVYLLFSNLISSLTVFYSASDPPLPPRYPQQAQRELSQPATENQSSLFNRHSAASASGSLRRPEQSPRPASWQQNPPYTRTGDSTVRYSSSKSGHPRYSASPLHVRDDNVPRTPCGSNQHYRNNLSPARNRERSRSPPRRQDYQL